MANNYTYRGKPCQVEGCERKNHARGLCQGHANRLRVHGDVQAHIPLTERTKNTLPCIVPNCEFVQICRGYCQAHYTRFKRFGDPQSDIPIRPPGPTICQVDGCTRSVKAHRRCGVHDARYRRHGDVQAHIPIQQQQSQAQRRCNVESCDRQALCQGYCSAHYGRVKKYGSPQADRPIGLRPNRGKGYTIKNGYQIVHTVSGRQIPRHRIIMEEYLGRELHADETVHHINGVRDDNRIENLELWSKSHPSGQRVIDKIQWAKELLRRYEPDALSSSEDEIMAVEIDR